MLGTITGRLVRDAEVKTVNTKDGDKSVCEFSIAANNRYGAKTEASFYNCSLWGAKIQRRASSQAETRFGSVRPTLLLL